MKIKSFQSLLFVLFFTLQVKSQECEVALASIKGNYEGECKNGKAEGQGKSAGTDTYEGIFKAGLPNGPGKYIWNNGNIFSGNWVKGSKQGQGVLIYKTASNTDSTVEGFWKKDKYMGLYEEPYRVIRKSVHVTSLQARKVNSSQKQVEIYLDSETGKGYSGVARNPVLTDVSILNGSYVKLTQLPNMGKKVVYIMEEITFPFKGLFTVDNDVFEIEFLEPGKWTVEVRMSF
ncbi:MAG: hypothetical protein ABIW38_06300 [Ferruginibacter sp.]